MFLSYFIKLFDVMYMGHLLKQRRKRECAPSLVRLRCLIAVAMRRLALRLSSRFCVQGNIPSVFISVMTHIFRLVTMTTSNMRDAELTEVVESENDVSQISTLRFTYFTYYLYYSLYIAKVESITSSNF